MYKAHLGLPPLRSEKTGRGEKALQPRPRRRRGVGKCGGGIPSPSDYRVSFPSGVRGRASENFGF